MSKGRISIVFLLWLPLQLATTAGAAETDLPQPVFHLSFENGLKPDVGPKEPCRWTGNDPAKATEPPQFHKDGVTGKALLIDDNAARTGYVNIDVPQAAVDRIKDRGTLLFWLRGLENWDIWNVGNQAQGNACFVRLAGGMIYKWGWYGEIALFGVGPTLFYPQFDQYQWTQLGVSWQSEGNGKTRNRIFLNGKLVGETTGALQLGTNLQFGGFPVAGARHLLDELKLYDRALLESEVKRLHRWEGRQLNRPLVSLPRLKTAPVIDGKIDGDEWAAAARITGMLEARTGELAADQSAFYLGYDDKNLYLAMLGEVTELARTSPALVFEKFLRSEHSGRDDKVDADDAVEIVLSPDYWKAGDRRNPGPWKEYRLLANAAAGYSAGSYGKDGADPKWNGNWQTASSVSSRGWQFEARISLDSMAVRAPALAERWGLELGRIWKHLKQEHNLWTWGRRFPADEQISSKRRGPRAQEDRPIPEQPDTVQSLYLHDTSGFPSSANMGVLQFGGDQSPVVRVERLGRLHDRQVDFLATLSNPATVDQPVSVRLFTDTAEVSHKETLILPARGKKEISLRREISDFTTSLLTFEAYDAGGKLLHRTAVPFSIKQAFDIRVIQYPNYDKLLTELDLGTLSQTPVKELRVDISIKDAAGKTALQKNDQGISSYCAGVELGTAGITPGDYVLSVAIRAGAKELVRNEKKFAKLGKAPWWNNRYGCEDMDNDMVPYPWTDMKVEKESVKVWGREYRFGKGLLPEQITTLDYPVLRAPIRVLVKTADGAVLDTAAAGAKAQWTKTNHTRVEATRAVAGAGFSLTNSLWAEYDGLVWNTLAIVPAQKITVTSMELEIPLTKEFSDVVNAPSAGHVGRLKREGLTAGQALIWLGNGDGGIQWIPAENKLFVQDPQKAMRVIVQPEGATLRLIMVDTPTSFSGPYEIQFGLIATPVRPKTWRTPEHPLYRGHISGPGPWFPQGLEFKPAADPGTDYYSGGLGGTLYVHTSPVNVRVDASGTDDVENYGYEWLLDPNQRPSPHEPLISTTTESKSFRDYFVWRHWRYQQKYGLGGYYFDNPNRTTLGTRDVMKRMYNVALLNHRLAARDHMIGMAANGCVNMGYMGFAIYHLDGEQFNSALSERQPTYRGLLDPHVYRAEFMGHNFGWTVSFLGQARLRRPWVEANGGPEAVVDHVQGLDLLHDSQPTGWHMPDPMNQVCNRAIEAYKKLDLSHWIYQFVPYWRQDLVSLPNENFLASFYVARPSRLKAGDAINGWHHHQAFQQYFDKHLPAYMTFVNFRETEAVRKDLEKMQDKAVMVVYNNGDFKGEMRLKPDWQKLGLGPPAELRAENVVHSTGFRLEKGKDKEGKEVEKAVFFARPEESARIENGEIIFPMTPWNYRMILLERKP